MQVLNISGFKLQTSARTVIFFFLHNSLGIYSFNRQLLIMGLIVNMFGLIAIWISLKGKRSL